MQKKIIWLFIAVLPLISNAQLGGLGNRVKNKINQRINKKVDAEVDKSLDEIEGKKTGRFFR